MARREPFGTPEAVGSYCSLKRRLESDRGLQRTAGWDLLPFLPSPASAGQCDEGLQNVGSKVTPTAKSRPLPFLQGGFGQTLTSVFANTKWAQNIPLMVV